jgi:hypothetical protein
MEHYNSIKLEVCCSIAAPIVDEHYFLTGVVVCSFWCWPCLLTCLGAVLFC